MTTISTRSQGWAYSPYMIRTKSKQANALTRPFLIQVSPAQEEAIEAERKVRGLKSRSETIRALLMEGLHRATVRRRAGKSVEIGPLTKE